MNKQTARELDHEIGLIEYELTEFIMNNKYKLPNEALDALQEAIDGLIDASEIVLNQAGL